MIMRLWRLIWDETIISGLATTPNSGRINTSPVSYLQPPPLLVFFFNNICIFISLVKNTNEGILRLT